MFIGVAITGVQISLIRAASQWSFVIFVTPRFQLRFQIRFRIAGVNCTNACYTESNLESQLESRVDKYDEGPLLVISKIDYCNILYFGLPQRILNNLQKVLNSCVRFIFNLRGHQDNYDEYFKEAHILPVQKRLTFKACLLAYKIVRGTAPEYLQELVPRDEDILGMRPTRANAVFDFYKLKYPKLSSVNANSKLRKRRLSVFLPTVWNSLPLDLRSVHPIELFKSKLKTRLFLEAFPEDSRCGV